MNGTTFFKTSDFKGLSQYPEDIQAGIISYLDSLNEVLNNIDYWDWKPIFPTVLKPLFYSLDTEKNFYTLKFAVVPDYFSNNLQVNIIFKEIHNLLVIFKEIHNLLDEGDGEDIPAKIRINSYEGIYLITVTKYFTI